MGFKVLGNKAAKLFKHETGKHVVQRCPPTENKGRRHTSTITVSILPILSSSSFTLKEQDIETKTQRGHGPGGQHQNTTDSAVRMVHKPTDTVVFINGRDQHSNKRLARQILEARVAEKIRGRQNRERSENKREQVDGGGRGNKTRTYNFLDSRVVDHILGTRTSKIKQVMKGRFDLLWK